MAQLGSAVCVLTTEGEAGKYGITVSAVTSVSDDPPSLIVCVNRALSFAPASIVVPYQYTLIVWAIVFGYIFFGDIPRPGMLIGGAIIIAAGLFIFFREKKVATGQTAEDFQPGP